MSKTGTLTPGQTLGRYEISAFLAAGGMGEVYKAFDTRLNRVVAIKRLTGPRSDRFQEEAHAIAALNHPHICQIYDVGGDYLVLEYIDGQQLQGPVSVDSALRLATQIASALEAAHSLGIFHRDLKPANVLVTTSGDAKLLDFGIAKRFSTDVDVTRTVEGTILGTAAYMSPEQAEGRAVDARSDIFSFGAVIYELISGRRAFDGATTSQVISAVLRDEPPTLQTSSEISRIVSRCLAKPLSQRYQSMSDVRTALEEVTKLRTRPDTQPSVAVLPFADMSAGKDHEWFSDGLTEEIINALTHIPHLKVIARTSAFAFKGRNEDVRTIAETLGVAHVLEGSVRKAGRQVRITAQLIRATDGSHLWSERYDRELADVFAMQDEVARSVSKVLQLTLAGDRFFSSRYTPKVDAYEALLRARHQMFQITPESLARVQTYVEQAIALDPGYALPHVVKGGTLYARALMGLRPAREVIPMARMEALKALELDPTLPEANAMLGGIAALLDYDWKETKRRFDLAVAREPISPMVRYWYGLFLGMMGETALAATQLRLAKREDPLSAIFPGVLANILAASGQNDEAAAQYEEARELDPRLFPIYEGLALVDNVRGRLQEAIVSAEQAHTLAPWNPSSTGILAGLLQRSGERTRAEELRMSLGDSSRYGTPMGHAIFHALCDEPDEAAAWLEKAIEQRDPRVLVFTALATGKVWRTAARWPELARMMKLPHMV